MKLIVGLGNPGRKYRGTRHNVGFDVLAHLHHRYGGARATAKYDSELVEVSVSGEKTLLQSPLTFMNNSGRAVRGVIDFYKLPLHDLLIVCDDVSLELGRLRFRPEGSAGGQKGLMDIIRVLGTPSFSRLRIGVGRPPEHWDVSDYVLSKFRDEESAEIAQTIKRAADGVEIWVANGTSECMNRFNADPRAAEKAAKKQAERAKNRSESQTDRVDQPTDTRQNHLSDETG